MTQEEILWKQYAQSVELFKFYLELIVKFNIFYYAVTGAIVSFFFANQTIPNIKYSLILPIIMNVSFIGFFIYGAKLMNILREEIFRIRDAIGLQAAPDAGVVSILLYIFSFVYFVITAALLYLLCLS